jgi:CDP-diacylglycerol--glycerol-3-phosphate 3-phosphatidyltransferase
MTLYALKPRFQALLRPAAASLARSGVTANQVTVAAAVLSVALGAYVAASLPDTRAFLLVPAWLVVRMALNALDGVLAREHGQKSRLGAFLNELGDVASDAALVAPFAWLAPFSPAWTAVVIALAIVAEYAGAMGPLAGASAGTTARWARAIARSSSARSRCGRGWHRCRRPPRGRCPRSRSCSS